MQTPHVQQQNNPPIQFQQQQTQPALQQQVRRAFSSQNPPICGLFNYSVFGNCCRWPQPCAIHLCPSPSKKASRLWQGKAMVVRCATNQGPFKAKHGKHDGNQLQLTLKQPPRSRNLFCTRNANEIPAVTVWLHKLLRAQLP